MTNKKIQNEFNSKFNDELDNKSDSELKKELCSEFNNRFNKLAIAMPDVLLPADGIDMQKWSVVACDQYTSQPEYWNDVDNIVGNEPSTLKLILPEVYLESSDVKERISKIDITMKKYLDEGILVSQKPGFIYLERKTPHVKSRKGLILAVDLEEYDYNKGSQTLIRATEKTVIERLPSRVRIRKNAPVEVPHIQLLIDDPDMTVIEPIAEKIASIYNTNNVSNIEKIYDFDLMMKGGHVTGYRISDREMIQNITNALEKLAAPANFYNKYMVDSEKGVLLFAVGDGNHSLASAKAHWENVKSALPPDKQVNHPARYAMVEVINVHDEGLVFEPIHRVLFNVDSKKLIASMKEYLGSYSPISFKTFSSKENLDREADAIHKKVTNCHLLPFVSNDGYNLVIVEKPLHNLDVATLQEFLDHYIERNPSTKIDYIHGNDVVTSIGAKTGNMGFYLPSIDKHELFKTVILDGTLPRKTFSMGEAEEKRYYLECRKIVP